MLKKLKGFSLLELIVTISIATILFALMIPSQKIFIDKTAEQVSSSQLLRAMSLARSEASSRGRVVSLCKSSDQKTCTGNWEQGQIIFVDENQNGQVQDSSYVLFSFASIKSGKIFWKSSLHKAYLQFLPTGFTNSQNGTFWFCEKDEKVPAWIIRVNRLGRARMINDAVEINKEKELTC
ncbi:MAG: GspH/FimT family pseudopilin [Gammaproteobacteria bacterium]|nr:GspH/FimT family pseudopilin [Gammaproteobacteria bacterium]